MTTTEIANEETGRLLVRALARLNRAPGTAEAWNEIAEVIQQAADLADNHRALLGHGLEGEERATGTG